MDQPVEYQTPLPTGRNLRYHELPGGLRVTREFLSQFALWRELLMPVFCVISLVGSGLFLVWNLEHRMSFDPLLMRPMRIGIFVVDGALLVWILRSYWTNAGVVTEVSVTREAVFWRKQNLWGSREYIWPLSAITGVQYDPTNRSMRIHRSRGTALNAFAYFPKVELLEVVFRLTAVIDQNRNSSGGASH
jgi:hypothetical protein